MAEFKYVGLLDFLAIAEANTDIDRADLADNAEVVRRAVIGLWAPTSEAYAELVDKAAILEYSLIRARPLPRNNVVVAHECMKEFAWRNGYEFDWDLDKIDPDALFQALIDGTPDALVRLTVWLRKTLVPR